MVIVQDNTVCETSKDLVGIAFKWVHLSPEYSRENSYAPRRLMLLLHTVLAMLHCLKLCFIV